MKNNFNIQIKEWKEETSTKRYKSKTHHFTQLLQSYIIGSDCVLELGCGVTSYPDHLSFEEYHAIDTSNELLKLNNNKKVNFYEMSALKLPSEWQDKFDVIFCAGVIHHIDAKHWPQLLENLRKCLKKNGRFIFIEPTITSLSGIYLYTKLAMFYCIGKNNMIKIMGFFDEYERYLNYFTFKKCLKEGGFNTEEYYTTQLLRMPPLFNLDKMNIEWINNRLSSSSFGTTLIGVVKKT